MECPVCYTDNCNCTLVCGHSFCKSCVRDWYIQAESEPTCPMCRSTMYFKGMHKVADQWEQEFEDKKWEDMYSSAMGELLEEVEDSRHLLTFIRELEVAYKKLRELHDMGYEFSWDFIQQLLEHPYCVSDMLVKPPRQEYWDDNDTIQARKTMLVSRYPQWRGLRI